MVAITQSLWIKLLDWGYNRALSGSKGMEKASQLALHYADPSLSVNQQINALIRHQQLLAGSSGFITGIGGLMSLPIAIPLNLASVVFIQLRMIAAIAHLGGFDIEDKRVKSMAYACMAGNAAKDIFQEIGIRTGTKLTQKLIYGISERSFISVNEKIGFALISRTGSKGLINLSKAVPIAGGIIAGSLDLATTALIGKIAKKTFIG
ncbi:MAG: EcsC family protein [Omnitrophica WOR_2 bacterium]|jgi:uncharacterized protein (DUF697 family)